MRELSKQLALLYKARNYEWSVSGEKHVPTDEDMDKMLDHIKARLDEQPGDAVQLEVGRLIVRREDGHLDVYVHFGEI